MCTASYSSAMDVNLERSVKTKLLQLECHFTWGLKTGDTDLDDLQDRLHVSTEICLGKEAGTARSYNLLAFTKYLQGFNEEALKNLEKAEELIRNHSGDECEKLLIVTYGDFAWVYYYMAQLTKAQSYLEKLGEIKEKFPTVSPDVLHPATYAEKAWSFLKFSRKHYIEAKECFEKAMEEEPDDSEWNSGYAITLYRLEGFQSTLVSAEDSAALKQLRRALELNPDDRIIMVLLGLKLADYKEIEEATELVEKALEMSPDEPHVIRYVAKFYRQQGTVDKSIELLQRALEKTPNSAFLHHQIALSYKRKKSNLIKSCGRARDAEINELHRLCIFHLEKTIMQKPSFIYAIIDLANLYAQSRDIPKAEELFHKIFPIAKAKNECVQSLHLSYGDFLFYHKRKESLAIKHYTEGSKLDQRTLDWERCLDKLSAIAEKNISRNSQKGEAFGILGFVHKMKNEKKHAVDCYEKALLCDSGNEDYLSALCDLRLSLE
ncbi:interferon-induced protein with tetratricopeptide repeats 5 [Amia ocellicauda]|uniref:interferon-induced protein with tetratricopeptide repeats 5 n=1 Tax=Amia ocellicauda TaxID=2972642 RepID=UPI0034640466